MRSPKAFLLRSASAFLFNRKQRRSRAPRLRFLREVYADYKALKGPKPGPKPSFWGHLRPRRRALPQPEASRNSGTMSTPPPSLPNSPYLQSPKLDLPYLRSLVLDSPQSTLSRRQRLIGLARATRDTYIPRLATSVTQIATGVTRSAPLEYDEFGLPLSFPKGTTFTMFPSYTRRVSQEESPLGEEGYVVCVHGWMWCHGLMTRKNRLILSLAKQVIRFKGDEAAKNAVDRLYHDPSLQEDTLNDDTQSIVSSSTTTLVPTADSVDALIKERLSTFIARSIPNAALSIHIGAHDAAYAAALVKTEIYTDQYGHFKHDIFVPYKPSVVHVHSIIDETICTFQEVDLVSSSGYGVISDIDDTVKLTGVIGDKRDLMSRLLVGDITTWNIPPVVKWYKSLLEHSDVTFHYVSNSPWQLFTLIQLYFDSVQLPKGSFHLKQYTGNIISSLMEPSSSRKRNSLFKLLQDFPSKSFICVGDSGEQDLEAYADVAKSHPGRVRAIYIRAVPDSFSNIEDSRILTELRQMIDNWNRRQASMARLPKMSLTQEDLIDLSDEPLVVADRAAKLPPLIPKKPSSLKGSQLKKPPPLPERTYLLRQNTQTDVDNVHSRGESLEPGQANLFTSNPSLEHSQRRTPPPPPPRRRTTTSELTADSPVSSDDQYVPFFQGVDEFNELEDVDSRGASWIRRLTAVLHDLDGTNTVVQFFEDHDEEFFISSLASLIEEEKN